MGETTGIAWTDSTINVWHGCDKVSAGCKHCYAEVSTPIRVARAGRAAVEAREATDDMPAVKALLPIAPLELWGGRAPRVETKSWKANLRKWNRAQQLVEKQWLEQPTFDSPLKSRRVFGQSLSDTFEDYQGGRVIMANGAEHVGLNLLRWSFLKTVEECTALTFQLLTKRPENIRAMVPPSWLTSWPAHVWIGCTVEDQENADRRIPHLLRVPAAVRFLSVEPQIGPVDLCPWLPGSGKGWGAGIQWVIQGGESGSKARPFDLAWARSMRDQCRAAGVAYFLKQFGANAHVPQSRGNTPLTDTRWSTVDSHGADESEWPADLRGCRAFPSP